MSVYLISKYFSKESDYKERKNYFKEKGITLIYKYRSKYVFIFLQLMIAVKPLCILFHDFWLFV